MDFATENEISYALEKKISPLIQTVDIDKGNNGNITNSSSSKLKEKEKPTESGEKYSTDNTTLSKGKLESKIRLYKYQ